MSSSQTEFGLQTQTQEDEDFLSTKLQKQLDSPNRQLKWRRCPATTTASCPSSVLRKKATNSNVAPSSSIDILVTHSSTAKPASANQEGHLSLSTCTATRTESGLKDRRTRVVRTLAPAEGLENSIEVLSLHSDGRNRVRPVFVSTEEAFSSTTSTPTTTGVESNTTRLDIIPSPETTKALTMDDRITITTERPLSLPSSYSSSFSSPSSPFSRNRVSTHIKLSHLVSSSSPSSNQLSNNNSNNSNCNSNCDFHYKCDNGTSHHRCHQHHQTHHKSDSTHHQVSPDEADGAPHQSQYLLYHPNRSSFILRNPDCSPPSLSDSINDSDAGCRVTLEMMPVRASPVQVKSHHLSCTLEDPHQDPPQDPPQEPHQDPHQDPSHHHHHQYPTMMDCGGCTLPQSVSPHALTTCLSYGKEENRVEPHRKHQDSRHDSTCAEESSRSSHASTVSLSPLVSTSTSAGERQLYHQQMEEEDGTESMDDDANHSSTAVMDRDTRDGDGGTSHRRIQRRCDGSTLCQCPCRNCATCPLRFQHKKEKKEEQQGRYPTLGGCHRSWKTHDPLRTKSTELVHWEQDDDPLTLSQLPLCSGLKQVLINFCMLEAKEDPTRFKYDVRVIPEHPLPNRQQRLLEITELPFLILWGYFTYWAVIVTLTAASSPNTVWLSAAVASVLVGIGLNANAYKSVTVPRRRGAVRHHRHARALLELKRYGQNVDTLEMKIDWGMVVRFFLIPFGVSSLSGLTSSNRDRFLLVFPRDPFYLMVSILCPTGIVIFLCLLRLFLLWKLKVRWSLQGLFLNGALVD